MKTVLTIAGSDSSGGAGIQADIKTITCHKLFATSAITALTAQNTTGVAAIYEVTPEFLAQQLDSIFTDIYPDAVKIGMVSNAALIHVIAEKLKEYNAANIVLDPVMVATSGARLIQEEALHVLSEELMPQATLLTPNIPEAKLLTQQEICNQETMEEAAGKLEEKYGCAVLVKGGHGIHTANDLLRLKKENYWFYGEKIDNPNTHGTGCTLSSAIACQLAEGADINDAVAEAKKYLTGAIAAQLNLGKGSGPLNHMYRI